MKRLAFLFLLALLVLACGSPLQETKVLRVIDGDTVVLAGGERLRYIGVDTPERGEPYYREATQRNRELVEGKVARLEKDVSERDRYGRLLRYVWVGDTFVNGELVRGGYAKAIAYPPDTRYQDLLGRLEREAAAAGRGLWSRPRPLPTPTP